MERHAVHLLIARAIPDYAISDVNHVEENAVHMPDPYCSYSLVAVVARQCALHLWTISEIECTSMELVAALD